jgi:hypothetical protein
LALDSSVTHEGDFSGAGVLPENMDTEENAEPLFCVNSLHCLSDCWKELGVLSDTSCGFTCETVSTSIEE